MKHTIKSIILLAAILIGGAGQAWASVSTEPDLGKIVYTTNHGSLAFYKEEACTNGINTTLDDGFVYSFGLTSVTVKDGSGETVIGYKVYIKATPDFGYTLEAGDETTGKVSFIKAEVTVAGTDVAGARTRGAAPTVNVGDFIDVTATETEGVYCVTMPADKNLNLHITATFPERPYLTGVSYIDPTKTGNAQNATTPGGTHVYILDGTETVLGSDDDTPTWYVVNSDVNLTTKLTFTGDTHLILADGKTLTIDASNDAGENGVYFGMVCKSVEESTTTYHDLTIYGQTEGTGKISSKMGLGGSAWIYDYYAKNITINGGQVEASGYTKGLGAYENITINGGQVSSQNAYITCGGTLTLGWSNATDFILANSYIDDQTIAIADGKVFMSGTDLFSGSVTATAINGKKLSPATFPGGMTISSEGGKLTANLDDTATGTLDIPTAIKVDQVVIERTFTSGKPSTVYLPFSIAAANVKGGRFYTFTGVDETKTPWEVNYSEEVTGDIQASTPYIFLPDDSNGGKIVVNNGSNKISVCTANPQTTHDAGNKWEFIGTYEPIQWLSDNDRASEIGLVYGFAAENKTVGETSYEVGQFVKIGSGAFINPMRAYLKRSATAGARTLSHGNAESLPETMIVVLRDANGETTNIGTFSLDYETGEWYSLDGRKLSGKPTAKGLYINNGKKVVIK